MQQVIPSDLSQDKLLAAKYYRDQLGWAVHPVCSPNDKNVAKQQRGKKPIFSDWPKWTVKQATDQVLEQYFGNGDDANLGIVVRPPYVVVDLDSKADNGESVRLWLNDQQHLLHAPREKTGGGAHLHFICKDLPEFRHKGKFYGKALTAKISDKINGELYFNGLNLVVTPSVHAKGSRYIWEKTGVLSEVSWKQLQEWFGFEAPDRNGKAPKEKQESKTEAHWGTQFKGDLKSLDIVKLAQKLGIYNAPINVGEGKHAISCPWAAQHSDANDTATFDTSTAIFEALNEGFPGFNCFHASHGVKTLKDVLIWCELQKPGVVDQCCSRIRTWQADQRSTDGRPRVLLPGINRPDSEFAADCGKILAAKNVWFQKSELVVELRRKTFNEKIQHLAFHPLRSIEVCTGIEDHVEIGKLEKDGAGAEVFVPVSMSDKTACILINSSQFKRELPRITRVLGYRIPVIVDNRLTFPELGFDKRFGIYTDPNAPDIIEMDQHSALMWLRELSREFCFDGHQSLTHFLARLLTPMCRPIMGWDARGPFWIFTANRSRLGKDYLAVIPGLLFDGYPNEDAPIEPKDSSETRKRITAAMLAGRNRMHFANCAGHIQDSALEQAITSKGWTDRILGGNTNITVPNELELSMSGNLGVVTYRVDLAGRSRHIKLYYAEESPNQRSFQNPDLHNWITKHRKEILSALAALIRHWFENGQPIGKTPFTSFPEFAKIVGGVMVANSLGDPCLPEEAPIVGGNEEERDMKTLFNLAHETWDHDRVELKYIISLITNDDDPLQLFGWINLSEKSGQTILGKLLRRYDGRIFEDIILKIHNDHKRPKFSFETHTQKENNALGAVDTVFGSDNVGERGDIGENGDIHYLRLLEETTSKENKYTKHDVLKDIEAVKVPKVTEVPTQIHVGADATNTTPPEQILPEVPIEVDANICSNWGENNDAG